MIAEVNIVPSEAPQEENHQTDYLLAVHQAHQLSLMLRSQAREIESFTPNQLEKRKIQKVEGEDGVVFLTPHKLIIHIQNSNTPEEKIEITSILERNDQIKINFGANNRVRYDLLLPNPRNVLNDNEFSLELWLNQNNSTSTLTKGNKQGTHIGFSVSANSKETIIEQLKEAQEYIELTTRETIRHLTSASS